MNLKGMIRSLFNLMKETEAGNMNSLFLDCAIPLVLLLVIAPFSAEIDLTLAHYFYNPIRHAFSDHAFFTFFYQWGLLPGQIFGIVAFFIFVFSFIIRKLSKWRRPALQVGLTLALGAGILTHAILKDHWQRPRPKQVEQFGGTEPFRPFYQPNFWVKGKFKSFPSGHAAMGFCFFALVIQGRRTGNRRLFFLGLFLAFGLGICLSLSRIAQGGHFFSDTFASACLMWMTAALSDWAITKAREKKEILEQN
jgi:lipid A 4'-phosphatase